MIDSLSIVFPAYNENRRLKDCFSNIEKFNQIASIKKVEYIFVDDGSADLTSSKIRKFIKDKDSNKYKLIKLKNNIGKGGALAKGVINAKYNWVLTLDTDISVSLLEIERWIKNNYIKNYSIYFGSRNLKKSKLEFRLHRKIIGIFFILICRLLLNIKIHDTQCGFKLYKKKVAKKIFYRMKEKRFAHDIEIVMLAKLFKIQVIELPVTWIHKSDSKLNLIKDSFNMLISLLKIKNRY
tara:strand:- start:336 stop:1049 length:714 start_codon:yes stop_codon:yes gene_type:complete